MATDLQEIQITAKPILPADKYVDTRDFRVDSITLIASDGTARDITRMVMELQVRQDIYLGFMSGECLITDAIDLHYLTALHGNEYLWISIKEPEQTVSIKKAFRIYKVSTRVPITNNAQRYVVYFVSDELVLSNTKKVSKAYKGSKVSDIAQDIMENYLSISPDKIDIDPTSEPVDIIIPNQRPAEAINWLASRASSSKDTLFFFFENLEGFHFRSIQSLFRSPHPIRVPFTFENKGIAKQMDMDKYAMDDWEGVKDFDVLAASSSGMYAMRLQGLDSFHQKISVFDYSLTDSPTLFKNPAMSNPTQEDGKTLFEQGNALFLTYITPSSTSTEKGMKTEDWVRRVMSMAAINNNLIEITVPGSIRVQAGSMVGIRFPYTITPPMGADMWDKRKSGSYLVVAVNQKFDLINHRFQTIALIARDSFPEILPPLDETLPDKIKKMNKNGQ